MPSGLKIFGAAGQSNMAGAGLLADIPATTPAYGSRIWNYKFNETWQNPAAEAIHDATGLVDSVYENGYVDGVGPLLFFADHFLRYSEGDVEVGLVPCAKGATEMDDWERPVGSLDNTTLYGATIGRMQDAAASGTIAGFIWYQGEGDAGNTTEANAWATKFTTMITNIRTDLSIPNLPVVFVQIGACSASYLSTHPDWPLVQTNQSKVVTIPRCVMVPNTDSTLLSGNDVHIDTASQQVIGERIANAMRVMGAGL